MRGGGGDGHTDERTAKQRQLARTKFKELLGGDEAAEAAANKMELAMFRWSAVAEVFDNKKYVGKLRQLMSNFKSNEGLRSAVLHGALGLEKLLDMTPEQLASDEVRKAVVKAREDAMEASRSDWDEANYDKVSASLGIDPNEGGLFRCGKCKSNKTQNHQMQTRYADEPMTVFLVCMDCGNRWKQ